MLRAGIVMGLILVLTLPAAAAEDKIVAAVAANFMMPFEEIAVAFEKESGIRVEPVFSSTGKLYAQIVNSGPYDIFLAADELRPDLLFREGLSAGPFVYARGEVVLWSANKDFCTRHPDWKKAVQSGEVKKIAIANPETAPYGSAALVALKAAGLYEAVQEKLVFPQDIGQAFQYAFTGAVQVGFCALSSASTEQGMKGCHYQVELSPPVTQAACILARTQNREAVERFAAFLMGEKAGQIKERYGYR